MRISTCYVHGYVRDCQQLPSTSSAHLILPGCEISSSSGDKLLTLLRRGSSSQNPMHLIPELGSLARGTGLGNGWQKKHRGPVGHVEDGQQGA